MTPERLKPELVAGQLLQPARAPLSGWYANPPAQAQAGVWLRQARANLQARLRAGESGFQLQVLAMLCRAWLDSEPAGDVAELEALAIDRRERALLDLVRGQLLASRKRHGAMELLDRGFRLAAPYLGTDEYFSLVRRHEQLSCLPWTDTDSAPVALTSLLNEAAVVKRLRGGERQAHSFDCGDTVG